MGRSFIRTVVWLGGIFGAIGLLLYLFVFDTMLVPGDDALFTASIMPTLHPEDRILVRRGSEPRSGQLVRCASPDPTVPWVIGRVMGVPGETVELRSERVYMNGKPLVSRHACEPVALNHPVSGQLVTLGCHVEESEAWTYSYLAASEYPEGTRTAVVEPGKLFLVSDNRHIHKDSRDFGQVDASTCEHVVFRLWGESFIDSHRRFTLLY